MKPAINVKYPKLKGKEGEEKKVEYSPSGSVAIFYYSSGWVLRKFIMGNPDLIGTIDLSEVVFESTIKE